MLMKKTFNIEVSEPAQIFIQMVIDKLKPNEIGEEPYFLEVGTMTDGSIIAIFTPV